MNAQLAPIEEALTRAGVAYQVRGVRFYDRPEVAAAIASAPAAARLDATGRARSRRRSGERWAGRARATSEDGGDGRRATRPASGRRARDAARDRRRASSAATRARTSARVLAELDAPRRPRARRRSADGVNLLTYHRAKGLEWDAVFLPVLEEGTLPIRQAIDDDEALAEERRLLYVGHHPGARAPRAVVGRAARDARPRGAGASGAGSCSDLRPRPRRGADPRAARAAGRRRRRRARPAGGRRRRPAVRGAPRVADRRRPGRGDAAVRRSPTTRRSRPSPRRGRDRWPRLRRVKGMGPAKLEKYGDEILAVVERTADG